MSVLFAVFAAESLRGMPEIFLGEMLDRREKDADDADDADDVDNGEGCDGLLLG